MLPFSHSFILPFCYAEGRSEGVARERRKDEREREKASEGEKEGRRGRYADRERQIERNVLYKCASI